ncbi:TetR/AcrR family transcriptional regulator [Actinomadura barringtoniae]|uniref:TetR/AcrR family transcriptional regulator n=1 Tax=Actinomadura barringtoniae TaxID=1427535 RepID=A0A939PFS0_9ACTN|nr:TetR/AcrR family transcriptional regulator [Actinomadura barringtoniae]MBO2447691.1 TetR/AcrR family transcriptional regulator [Actinomadura barringtoniae]
MPAQRRFGSPDAKNRMALLDAAEELMLEAGFMAVSSRRVAERAGLKPQLVHYYFRTMDELVLEMFRRRAEEGLAFQAQILASDRPLQGLWAFSIDPTAVAFTMEYVAMANRSEAVRDEIARYAEQFRQEQAKALAVILERAGISSAELPPAALSVVMTSLARVVIMEKELGMKTGHEEAFALFEKWLVKLEEGQDQRPGT